MDKQTIFAIGEIDGKILEAFDKVFTKEKELGITCDWIICPGGMGVWPNLKYVDKATRVHGDIGDFHRLYSEGWEAPRNLLFISGAHEDHLWLNYRYINRDTQILPNIHHLVNGHSTIIGPKVVGLGKVFSPKVYNNEKRNPKQKYYTRREVEKACSNTPCDIVLSYQGPLGEKFGTKKSNSEGIKTILHAVKPQIAIHSGYNYSKKYSWAGIPIVSLSKLEILPLSFDKKTNKIEIIV